jgi:hypothetical protein
MLQLEIQMRGHPIIAKQMEPYLPGKSGKQIRDKRKEAPYKRVLQSLSDTPEAGATSSRNLKANGGRAHHVPETSAVATPPAQEQEIKVSEPSEGLDRDGGNTKLHLQSIPILKVRKPPIRQAPTGNGFPER